MGLLNLGVCGECSTDADCGPGQSCSAPAIDTNQGTLIGAMCL